MTKQLKDQLKQLQQQLQSQESLRGILPDDDLNQIIDTLTEAIDNLQTQLSIAERGAYIDGDAHAPIITGDKNKVIQAETYIENQNILPAPTEHWRTHYLTTIAKRYGHIDLTTINETQVNKTARVSISEVYTSLFIGLSGVKLTKFQEDKHSLWAEMFKPHTERRSQTDIDAFMADNIIELSDEQRERLFNKPFRADDEDKIPITAVEAVNTFNRLVILGHPGGGKSTLVNQIATQIANWQLGQADIQSTLPGWDPDTKLIPIRIILRRFATWIPNEETQPSPGLIWRFLEHQFSEIGCAESFQPIKEAVLQEGGLFLFDGLDEVSETDATHKRTLLMQTIEQFAETLQNSKHIVTCREYAYKPKPSHETQDSWVLATDQFPVIELMLFDNSQIQTFCRAWYQEVGPNNKGWSLEKAQKEAAQLAHAVTNQSHLYALGQYPLLLTLMAEVHGQDGNLPEDRADLYGKAIRLLLARWDNHIYRDLMGETRVEPGLVMRLKVEWDTIRRALQQIAYNAHTRQESETDREEGAADISRSELWDTLESTLGSYDKAKEVTDYIQDRAGLLQAETQHIYKFPHRTFQEYLAAAHIWNQPEPEKLLNDLARRDLEWWREVILLAAGISNTPSNVVNLVEFLIVGGESLSSLKASLFQLSARLLYETKFHRNLTFNPKDPLAIPNDENRFDMVYEKVRTLLKKGMVDDQLLAPYERLGLGDSLNDLGDNRRGVGLLKNGSGQTIPDINLCYIPPGPFWMGAPDDDPDANENEKPIHQMDIPYGYWLAQYPVSVAQYSQFIKQTNTSWQPRMNQRYTNYPADSVSWYDALAYCQWLTEKGYSEGWLPNTHQITLPSEAEWEKAARGGITLPNNPITIPLEQFAQTSPHEYVDQPMKNNRYPQRRYPWGNAPITPNHANYTETNLGTSSPIGIFPAGVNPYEVYELSGNLFEWTRSNWGEWDSRKIKHNFKFQYPYQEQQTQREDLTKEKDWSRVIRGGYFESHQKWHRCALRLGIIPNFVNYRIGFRLSVSPLL